MKRLKIITGVIWLALVATMFSAQGVSGDGKELSSKEFFKQNCRVCHEKDSPDGEYSPMSLTQDQWKAFFKTKFEDRHKEVILKRENKKLLEYLTEKDIQKVQKYCVDHAADSEQPQTCSE